MIVILEGVNRVGKTTLSLKLKELGFTYFKDENVEQVMKTSVDKMSFYKGRIISALEMMRYININLVIDRFHLSEFTYGLVERGYMADYMINVDKALKNIGAKLIHMTDDIEKINERAGRDLSNHLKAMELFYSISTMDKMEYNLNNNLSEVINFLKVNRQPQLVRKEG